MRTDLSRRLADTRDQRKNKSEVKTTWSSDTADNLIEKG